MATIFRPPLAVKPWIRPTTSAVVSQQQGSPYSLLQQPFIPREFVTYPWKFSRAAITAQDQGEPFPIRGIVPFIPREFVDYRWKSSIAAVLAQQQGVLVNPLSPFIPREFVDFRWKSSAEAVRAQPQGEPIPLVTVVPFVPREFVNYRWKSSITAALAQPDGTPTPPIVVLSKPFYVFDTTVYAPYHPVPDPQPPGSWYPIFPPAPPPPPSPVDTRGVVFAVDVQDGFTVGATLYAGKPAVMIMNVDAVIPSTDLLVVFTKPDGTVVYSRSPYTYTGIVDMAALGAHFQKFEYIVYTFISGELDQRGLWTAYLQAGVYAYPKGYFTVH